MSPEYEKGEHVTNAEHLPCAGHSSKVTVTDETVVPGASQTTNSVTEAVGKALREQVTV